MYGKVAHVSSNSPRRSCVSLGSTPSGRLPSLNLNCRVPAPVNPNLERPKQHRIALHNYALRPFHTNQCRAPTLPYKSVHGAGTFPDLHDHRQHRQPRQGRRQQGDHQPPGRPAGLGQRPAPRPGWASLCARKTARIDRKTPPQAGRAAHGAQRRWTGGPSLGLECGKASAPGGCYEFHATSGFMDS